MHQYGVIQNVPTAVYPSNMYSTSYIRANALNSGGCGYIAVQGSTNFDLRKSADCRTTSIFRLQIRFDRFQLVRATKYNRLSTHHSTHKYARLTMPTVKGSLVDYIVTPAQVAYQETENHS